MESRRLRAGKFRGMCVCVALLVAALTPTVAPAQATAASPVLEFVSSTAFPIGFTASGGEVTAALTGFNTVVHCDGSSGGGEVTGPRSTVSSWVFTGCETEGGTEGGRKCKSEGAGAEEIRSGDIESDLVYIDQAKHEVGMLLNPGAGIYLSFECAGEPVKARGPFLSPVGPINQEATSFTAVLNRLGATQTPNEYENWAGGKVQAIPTGERGVLSPGTTGVQLGFTIDTDAPLQIRAVTAQEVEAERRAEEAAAADAAKRRQEEEAALAAVAKRRQEEEAALAALAKRRQEEEAKAQQQLLRARQLSKALRGCRKIKPGPKRSRCQNRARKKYGGNGGVGA